jgi:hypothetical protein
MSIAHESNASVAALRCLARSSRGGSQLTGGAQLTRTAAHHILFELVQVVDERPPYLRISCVT